MRVSQVITVTLIFGINYAFTQVKNKLVPKFELTDTIGEWNYGNLYRDSLKQEFIQNEVIKQFNAARKAKGIAPLTADVGLKPAAVHNAIYNRYCMHKGIVQYAGSETTMTHFQNIDIPNFNEIPEVGARIKLLDQSKFNAITEELTFNPICACNPETFQQAIAHVVNNFKASEHHWADITNKHWDAVYVYYDLHATELFTWTNPVSGKLEPLNSMNVMIFVILGEYKK